jgi:hypothetical protein
MGRGRGRLTKKQLMRKIRKRRREWEGGGKEVSGWYRHTNSVKLVHRSEDFIS